MNQPPDSWLTTTDSRLDGDAPKVAPWSAEGRELMLSQFGPRARPLVQLSLAASRKRRRWRLLAIAASQLLFHGLRVGGLPLLPSMAVTMGVVFVAVSDDFRRRIALRLRMLRTQRATAADLNAVGTAECLRFVGTVEADVSPFPALGTDIPAVFVHTTFRQPNHENYAVEAQDVRGVRFRVRLADGSAVRVNHERLSVVGRRSRLANVPPQLRETLGVFTPVLRWLREHLHQQRIRPGDRVEVMGRLDVAPSPDGEAAPGRGTPMLRTMTGIGDEDVVIRVVAPKVGS